MSRRLSPHTRLVLEALIAAGDRGVYGVQIAKQTGLKSGTLYPILIRLADRGWLDHRWQAAKQEGRPPRHIYTLAGKGRAAILELDRAVRSQRREELA